VSDDCSRQAVLKLLDQTFHGDKVAVARFLKTRHRLLGGRIPLEAINSGQKGSQEVAALICRANAGFAI